MKKLRFQYTTKLTFDNNVYNHSFALRCVPVENAAQKCEDFSFKISPYVSTNRTVDAFGNIVLSGLVKEDHRFLDFEVAGVAVIDSTQIRNDFMPCYKYQSEYTKPGDALKAFYEEIVSGCDSKDPSVRTEYFSKKLSEKFTYQKNTTDISTTAEEAFKQGCGVCQDYSHILLSILRMDGIPCRYKAGLACCDGESHSWVDVWLGDRWKGYDPTNLCEASETYLSLTQGRDFGDCAIDRGVMYGSYTRQMQLVDSRLVETF